MSLLAWFNRNWADTDEPGDPAIVPVDLALPPDQALAHVQTVIGRLPRWRVETIESNTLHVTRRTFLWRFVDDITLRLEPTATGTRLHARSKSRIGSGDLGQNRRSLLQLFRALKA